MSCQRPPTSRTKALPHCQPLGLVRPRFCKLYSKEHGLFLKTHTDNSGDFPVLFIDLESTPKWGDEIHFAIAGRWRKEDARESGLKPDTRVDGYIPRAQASNLVITVFKAVPPAEIPHLLETLAEIYLRKEVKR